MDDELVRSRVFKAQVMGRAHAMAADSFDRRQRWLAVPTIIMSTIVGASAIASMGEFGKAKFWLDLIICILSVTVAILTSLQQYLDYAGRSQKHASTAARLFTLSRKWELLAGLPADSSTVEALEAALGEILEKSPRCINQTSTRCRSGR